jgi:hypothetical protein
MGQPIYCFFVEWGEPIKEFILTAVAVAAAVVAIIGLTTWRRQLGGTAEYELARRILKEVYQFREALQSVRFPFISVREMELTEEDGPPPTNDKDKRYRELAKAYQNRYIRVNETKSALEATLLEVEVLWGTELIAKVRKLYNWDGELYAAILDHLDAISSDVSHGGRQSVDIKKTRDTMNARGDKNKDEFLQGLQADIQEIEKDVKPHLKRFF